MVDKIVVDMCREVFDDTGVCTHPKEAIVDDASSTGDIICTICGKAEAAGYGEIMAPTVDLSSTSIDALEGRPGRAGGEKFSQMKTWVSAGPADVQPAVGWFLRETLLDACTLIGVHIQMTVLDDAYDRFLRLANICRWRQSTFRCRKSFIAACLYRALCANGIFRPASRVAEAVGVTPRAFLRAEKELNRKLSLPTVYVWPHVLTEYVGDAIGMPYSLIRSAIAVVRLTERAYFGVSAEKIIFAVLRDMWAFFENNYKRLRELDKINVERRYDNPVDLNAAKHILGVNKSDVIPRGLWRIVGSLHRFVPTGDDDRRAL
jgi:hypothetical protein